MQIIRVAPGNSIGNIPTLDPLDHEVGIDDLSESVISMLTISNCSFSRLRSSQPQFRKYFTLLRLGIPREEVGVTSRAVARPA